MWHDLAVHGIGSEQSESKFAELTSVGAYNAAKLMTPGEYSDLLAPLNVNEDFSTASLMRDAGDNLTGEKLAALTPLQMIEKILVKSGIIHFSRLYRVLSDGCGLAKVATPSVPEVIACLMERAYVLPDKSLFIARSELQYPDAPRRSLWC